MHRQRDRNCCKFPHSSVWIKTRLLTTPIYHNIEFFHYWITRVAILGSHQRRALRLLEPRKKMWLANRLFKRPGEIWLLAKCPWTSLVSLPTQILHNCNTIYCPVDESMTNWIKNLWESPHYSFCFLRINYCVLTTNMAMDSARKILTCQRRRFSDISLRQLKPVRLFSLRPLRTPPLSK